MLRYLFAFTFLALLTACTGGDFDLEKITEIEAKNTGDGDGDLWFYRDGQVISPAPPATITTNNDVELGYIIIFTPGPSATVPDKIPYKIEGVTDKNLPQRANSVELIYVPPRPPFPPIAPEIWCVFNPGTCAAMFTEGAFSAGDFYYGVIIQNMGKLPIGTHDYQISIDAKDLYSPKDEIGNVKTRSFSFTVSPPSVIAQLD